MFLILNLYQGHFGASLLSLHLSMLFYWITKLLNLAGQIFIKTKLIFTSFKIWCIGKKLGLKFLKCTVFQEFR